MFVQSTAIAQLVITLLTSFGTSVAAGMMIENIPFMNAMAMHVYMRASKADHVLPTVLFCYSFSTFLIAISFYFICRFKWANYFKILPQYLLDGLLAGIGIFLVVMAVQITQQSFQLNPEIDKQTGHPLNQRVGMIDGYADQDFRNYSSSDSLLQIVIGALMGLTIFLVNLFLPSFQFAIPLLTTLFIAGFWIIFRIILCKSLRFRLVFQNITQIRDKWLHVWILLPVPFLQDRMETCF